MLAEMAATLTFAVGHDRNYEFGVRGARRYAYIWTASWVWAGPWRRVGTLREK